MYDPDPHGLLESRLAVCRYYANKNIHVSPEQIFLTAGSSEAYNFLFRLLADPGELVLAPKPGYPLFDYLSDLNDIQQIKYPLIYTGAWRIDMAKLETLLKERPRALIFVNPGNPTGNFVSKSEREAANKLCRNSDTALISDEVFLDFIWNTKDNSPASFAGNNEVLTFSLGGVSKMLGLPQMKVSWIVVSGPEPAKQEAIKKLEVISDTYLSVNTSSQRALPFWFSRQQEIAEEIRQRVLHNLAYLEKKMNELKNVRVMHAEGGWQAILEARASSLNDEETVLRLLEEKNVLIHPGYFFDLADGNFFVLSLLLPPQNFQEAVDRLSFV